VERQVNGGVQVCTGTTAAADATSEDTTVLASLRARDARDGRSGGAEAARSLFFEHVCMRLPFGFAHAVQLGTEAVVASVVSMCSASQAEAAVLVWCGGAFMAAASQQHASQQDATLVKVRRSQRRRKVAGCSDEMWLQPPPFLGDR